jgi:dTDP-L-rhamnose 4-epimerase
VGVGSPLTVVQVAQLLARQLGVDVDPEVTGKFRAADIRHCWADPTREEKLLGFTAEIPLEAGVAELIDWVFTQKANDRVDKAYAGLGQRGLAF